MSRFQYPHSTARELKVLKRFNESSFLALMFAMRRWRHYYTATATRSLRFLSDRYSHLVFTGHIDLPPDFVFRDEKASPRGTPVDGQYFSCAYSLIFADMPPDVVALVRSFRSILECFFASDVNVRDPHIWRNEHIPAALYARKQEVFADGFHQDLVFDQFNVQLFVLLHDTSANHGPLEYLDSQVQRAEMSYYRKRDRKAAVSETRRFVGKRGDYALLSTGSTLHRASNPSPGCHRDILSIAFFPSYTSYGTPIEQL